MSALLRKFAVLNNMDLVDIDYRGESMRTVYDCLATHDVFQLSHDFMLGIRVQVARRFIEEEYLCLWLEKPTCDQDSLALASG